MCGENETLSLDMKRKPTISVRRVHFEDFDGHEFERLALAYLIRKVKYKTIEWYGETGSDLGRDIWIVEVDGSTMCVQCANRKQLAFAKVQHDLERIESGEHGIPKTFIVIAGASVSSQLRKRIKKAATDRGILSSEVWSGSEFEERLRAEAEPLLKRFAGGEAFPDSPEEMKVFVASATGKMSDEDILKTIAVIFDRPAFSTPFFHESNLPNFKQAITDTIEALNTGVRHTKEGREIPRIPTRHEVENETTKEQLRLIQLKLIQLRAAYDSLLRTGELRLCSCGDQNCSAVMMSDSAIRELDTLRNELLGDFRRLYPKFSVRVGF
jgi:hypothetical protein